MSKAWPYLLCAVVSGRATAQPWRSQSTATPRTIFTTKRCNRLTLSRGVEASFVSFRDNVSTGGPLPWAPPRLPLFLSAIPRHPPPRTLSSRSLRTSSQSLAALYTQRGRRLLRAVKPPPASSETSTPRRSLTLTSRPFPLRARVTTAPSGVVPWAPWPWKLPEVFFFFWPASGHPTNAQRILSPRSQESWIRASFVRKGAPTTTAPQGNGSRGCRSVTS